MAGREGPVRGRAGPQEEGRKATGRSGAEPQLQGDGEKEGLSRPLCHTNHRQQVRQPRSPSLDSQAGGFCRRHLSRQKDKKSPTTHFQYKSYQQQPPESL